MTGPPIGGYVFDADGTLFDVHAVVEVGREVTADPMALSAAWRQKQLVYTWRRALMGRYEDLGGHRGRPPLRAAPAGEAGAAAAGHPVQWLAADAAGRR